MSVLRDMGGRIASRVDDAAALWLSRPVAGGSDCAGALKAIRSIAAIALVALPAVPVFLSVFLPLSLALPVGAALVASGALLAAAVTIGGAREVIAIEAPVARDRGFDPSAYDLLPGLVTVHDPRGTVVSVHGRDAANTFSGLRIADGRSFVEQIHVSDRIAFLQAIDRLRQGESRQTIDFRMDRPDIRAEGEQFVHFRSQMSAVLDADQRLAFVVVQSCDVSAEVALRLAATAMAAKAESANDAKTRFLAAVSHELRTPLNAILGFSGILAGEYFGKLQNDRQREYVDLIHKSGTHLLAVVNTMLDMSKIDAGRYELVCEPFDAVDAVNACEAMLGLQAREKGVSLTSRIQRTVGEVHADQRAFQQILINLVGNAIKFTDDGGLVTIDAAVAGPDLVLTVSDTGIGIAEDKLQLIGQPFVQIQSDYTRNYEGTGLGLSLVKGLVALHGGTFTIRSRPGEGTVITVTIPLEGNANAAEDTAEGDDAQHFEFPPRLKERGHRAGQGAGQSAAVPPHAHRSAEGPVLGNGDAGHDGTQAKTA